MVNSEDGSLVRLMRFRRAFTLMELLITVVILSVVASVAVVGLQGYKDRVAMMADDTKMKVDAQDAMRRPSVDKQPRMRVQDTAYGFRYGAIRKPIEHADRNQYVRTSLWVAPSTAMFPASKGEGFLHIYVPIDDVSTAFWSFRYSYVEPYSEEERVSYARWTGLARDDEHLNEDFRSRRHRGNYWLQDRQAMRSGKSFTGIKGVNIEDFAMAESMGPIAPRRRENLGTTDLPIIHMRRTLLRSLERFEAGGRPVGLEEKVDYARLRADDAIIPLGTPWQSVGAFAGESQTDDDPADERERETLP